VPSSPCPRGALRHLPPCPRRPRGRPAGANAEGGAEPTRDIRRPSGGRLDGPPGRGSLGPVTPWRLARTTCCRRCARSRDGPAAGRPGAARPTIRDPGRATDISTRWLAGAAPTPPGPAAASALAAGPTQPRQDGPPARWRWWPRTSRRRWTRQRERTLREIPSARCWPPAAWRGAAAAGPLFSAWTAPALFGSRRRWSQARAAGT